MTVSQIKKHQGSSVKELIQWLEHNKITEVECIFPDFAGSSKGKILPVNRFIKSMEDQSLKLADSVFGQTVSGKWVYESEVIDYVEEDLIMIPDFTTIRKIPWNKEPTAQIICDLKYSVSIETSNAYTIEEIDPRVSIILDIKTPASNEAEKNIVENYNHLKSTDEIKFVICNLSDFNWSKDYIEKYNLTSSCQIIFSPSYEEMPLSELADLILRDGLNVRLQAQLHKTIWGPVDGK